MRNALESGLKEQRERKNKSKVTQELVERKVEKKQKKRINVSKKIRESLTQMKKKRENSKVKEYEKLGKIK